MLPGAQPREEANPHCVLCKPLPDRTFPSYLLTEKTFPRFPAHHGYFSVKVTNVRLGEETEEPESCMEKEW